MKQYWDNEFHRLIKMGYDLKSAMIKISTRKKYYDMCCKKHMVGLKNAMENTIIVK